MKRGLLYLVVFAILSILCVLLFPVFPRSRERARLASGPAQIAMGPAPTLTAAVPGASVPSASGLPQLRRGIAMSTLASRGGVDADLEARKVAFNSDSRYAGPPAAVHPLPQEIRNPNLYLSNGYIGGNGARDRIEKLIRNGVLVDGKRVKLEAFPRSYAQAFPIPTRTALNLIADTERGKIIQEGDHTYLQVGLQAIQGEAPRRPPLNVALVIDCSGSMGQEGKLEAAKAAAIQLVERLHGNDILSVVTFDDDAHLLWPAQKAGDTEPLKRQIAALAPGSGTNIYEGLKSSYAQAQRYAGREGVSRVILLSDGEVTSGVTDPVEFQRLAAAQVDREIQTTTVGMGVDFNEELMLAIAREGKGNYHFIKDGADTQTVFAKELEELTHVVARAVKLRVRLADGVGLVRVLGATTLDEAQTRQVTAEEKKIDRKVYEELGIAANRQKEEDEPGIKLLIPNFYRGDHHLVMLEVAIPPGHGTRRVADVFLKYKDLVARANREARATVDVGYTPDRAAMIASIDRNVKKNLLGFQTGEALTEAAALISQGRVAEAARKIDERMVVLGVAAREWRDRDLDRDGALLDRYKTVLAQLRDRPQLAGAEFGQYLKKSLTYAGYTLTR
jgi:Ca-activated chloride channel family protein